MGENVHGRWLETGRAPEIASHEYVHDNPLRRGLVSRAPSFPGSAWERTAGEAPPPAPGSAFEGMQAEPAGIAFPGRAWNEGFTSSTSTSTRSAGAL